MDENAASEDITSSTKDSLNRHQHTETSRATAAYPRKRALKACRTCRMRKTKCNNERPGCGFCQSLGATCVYEDSKDISTFDAASQLILDRLDQVLQKLDERTTWPAEHLEKILQRHGVEPVGSTFENPLAPSSESDRQGPAVTALDQSTLPVTEPIPVDDDLNLDVNMMTPPCRISPDAVLDWPIFQRRYHWGYLSDSLFSQGLQNANPPDTLTRSNPGSVFVSYSSINEESVPRLVEAFLARVHIKVPVLDIKIAKEYARTVAQEGVRWTGPSCLVLIMSALGGIAPPLSDLYNHTASTDDNSSSVALHGPSLTTGNGYYEAACKRIGMLEPSILATQCIYICGVYEMYIIRPLHAWRWFSHASSTLYMYLKFQDAFKRDNHDEITSIDTERLEASVYWSAYKSMCELRTELPLPASLLFEVEYPHVLPTPPSNFGTRTGFDSDLVRFSSLLLMEQAWFFYLTDIILSRLGTRVLLAMYDIEHSGWDDSKIYRLIRAANNFKSQLKDWFEGFPEALRFDDFDIRPDHELRFTVQARALEIKAWLYRPFLYYTIHHQSPPEIADQALLFVQKAIDSSIHWILLWPVRHRHHGSWYVGRLVLSSALSIIAAIKAGLVLDSLNDWSDIVREAISIMEYWSKESPDFERGRVVLTSFQAELAGANMDGGP